MIVIRFWDKQFIWIGDNEFALCFIIIELNPELKK